MWALLCLWLASLCSAASLETSCCWTRPRPLSTDVFAVRSITLVSLHFCKFQFSWWGRSFTSTRCMFGVCLQHISYFSMHNAHFYAQIFEGKIGCTLHMGIMITYHGYNNPLCNAHKMWVSIIHDNMQGSSYEVSVRNPKTSFFFFKSYPPVSKASKGSLSFLLLSFLYRYFMFVCVCYLSGKYLRKRKSTILDLLKSDLDFLYEEWNDIFYIFVFYLYLWHQTIKSVFHQGWDLLMFISLMYLTCLELLVL